MNDKKEPRWTQITALILLLVIFTPILWVPVYLREKFDKRMLLVTSPQNQPLSGVSFLLKGDDWQRYELSDKQGRLAFSKSKTQSIDLIDRRYAFQTWKVSKETTQLVVTSAPNPPKIRRQEELIDEVVEEMMKSQSR